MPSDSSRSPRKKHRPADGSSLSGQAKATASPPPDCLKKFLQGAAAVPAEEGLSPEEAAADRRICEMFDQLAGDQAERVEIEVTPPLAVRELSAEQLVGDQAEPTVVEAQPPPTATEPTAPRRSPRRKPR